MRIDAHQHFWRFEPGAYGWIDESMAAIRRDFLPDALRPLLAGAGVDACVAVQTRQTLEETRWLLELAEAHPFIAGVVGWIDLQSADVRGQIEGLARRRKLVGVRHLVQGEADPRFLLRPEFCRGIAELARLDLAYDILIYPRHLAVAVEFAERFPDQRFVLDHLAKPEIRSGEIRSWARELRRLAALPNVCAKLSGLVTEADWQAWTPAELRPYLDVAFESFGWERLMAGSDWPVCLVAANYGRVMGVVADYLETRPRKEQDAVLGGNAVRFWNLDREEPKS